MIRVDDATDSDVGDLTGRVARRLRDLSHANALIEPLVDETALREHMERDLGEIRVARSGSRLVGHLASSRLSSPVFGESVWISPGMCSADDLDVLVALFVDGADRWRAEGRDHVYVWVGDLSERELWSELGFAPMHQRGARRRSGTRPHPHPPGLEVRAATLDDLDGVVNLDDQLQADHESGPSYARGHGRDGQRDEWIETLSDPQCTVHLVEDQGRPVAMVTSFPLPMQVGSHPLAHHLSALVVTPRWRGRGLGRSLVEGVLDELFNHGTPVVETNWRVTHRPAGAFWASLGFQPTFRRMHRHLGDD